MCIAVDEAGVEAVARARGIYDVDREARVGDALHSLAAKRAVSAALHGDSWDLCSQRVEGLFQFGPGRDGERFLLIGQKDVRLRQRLSQAVIPLLVGVPVGVHRHGGPGAMRLSQKFRQAGLQQVLQEVARHMHMPRARQQRPVHHFGAQRVDGAEVGQDGSVICAVLRVVEDHAEAGFLVGAHLHAAGIHAALAQAVQHKAAEEVVADHAAVGGAQPQPRTPAGEDDAGAARRQRGVVDHFFGLSECRARPAGEDQIDIDLAED